MEPFKNKISPQLVGLIARHLDDPSAFEVAVVPRLEALELRDRVQLVADELVKVLPAEPLARHAKLRDMLHPEMSEGIDRSSDEHGITGWGVWPLSLVVAEHGAAVFDDAMETLRQMTKRATAEFAIRHLIVHDPDRAFDIIAGWLDDPDHHVRRLISEGTRPRLPWGLRLKMLVDDPAPTLPLLEALKDDPSEYVRRSVANHLNDIAKDHPDLAVQIAGRWYKDAPDPRRKLVRHAMRHLVKTGHAGAMAIFGHGPAQVAVSGLTVDRDPVRMGEDMAITAKIASQSDKAQSLVVDYVLHLMKANGQTAPKVFKGLAMELAPGETATFQKVHKFRPVTTRRAYGGGHAVALRINGADTETTPFELIVD